MRTNVEILRQESLMDKNFNIYGDYENPLFLAKDVAEWIEHSNSRAMVDSVDDDEKVVRIAYTPGGNQEQLFLTENGVYEVLMLSRKPIAKQFKKGVKEILNSIRKHGAFMTSETIEKALLNPDTIIKLATNLKEEQNKRIAAEKQVSALKPKAALMDKIIDSGEKIDIGQTAKILGLNYGRNTLFKNLRELGIFFKNRNEPKQEYIDRGYFELKEQWIERNNHDGFMVIKVLVTQRGLEYINRILEGCKSDGKQMKIA